MVLPVVGALIARGVEPTPLLCEVGIDPRSLGSASARFRDDSIQALWLRAPEYARCPDLGLKAAQLYRPGTFALLDELASSAETLADAFVRGTTYLRILHDVAELRLTVMRPLARIEFMPSLPAPMPRATTEFFMASLVLVGRKLSGLHEHPRAVYFRHTEPECTASLEEFFACPLHFGAERTQVVFPASWLELPCIESDPVRRRAVERHAQRELQSVPQVDDFLLRVRLTISRELDGKEPSLLEIAKALAVSARTLRRRLNELNTSYSEQLDGVKQRFAARYLLGGEPVSEVARRLGFKTRGAFFKAHKRWTGLTPGELKALRDTRTVGARPLAFVGSLWPLRKPRTRETPP